MTSSSRATTQAGSANLLVHRFRCGPVSVDVAAAGDLDPLLEQSVHGEIPYWAVVWESAHHLAHWAVRQRAWAGTRVLELGCGQGLVGLVLAALGARVTQTDSEPAAVLAARANAERNRLAARMEHRVACWDRWPLLEQWPMVVGSDLTYARAGHAPLLAALDAVLEPRGCCYLADPGRPAHTDFLAAARARGWSVHRLQCPGGYRAAGIFALSRSHE
jgi:predicted nicotinamide N-methyase